MIDGRVAYATFEKVVLYLYNRKLLTQDLLDSLAECYRPVRVDSAGSNHMRAHDGKDLYQVCIALIDPAFPIAIEGSREDHEEYWEKELQKWEEIIGKRWSWYTLRTAPQHDARSNWEKPRHSNARAREGGKRLNYAGWKG